MRMDRKNPVLKVNAPRFVLWLKGFLDGKVLHTAGIDPENGTVTSGYVTSQLLRFEAACEKRIADTDKKLSPLWTEADHILIDLTRGIGVDTSRENEKRTDMLKRLADIGNQVIVECFSADSELEAASRELSSMFAAYAHGVLLQPVHDRMIPVIDRKYKAEQLCQLHDITWQAMLSTVKGELKDVVV